MWLNRTWYIFEETNLVDYPDKKEGLIKLGYKYPKTIKKLNRGSNADVQVLVPYVNYKTTFGGYMDIFVFIVSFHFI